MPVRKTILFLCLFRLLCLSGAAAAEPLEEEVFVLHLACMYPEDHPVQRRVLRPWAAELARLSEGRLLIRLYPPKSLVPEKEQAQAVRLGSLDMGHAPLSAAPAIFPLNQALGLDLELKNPLNAQAAFWRVYAELPEIRNEFGGIKILALHARQPYDLYMFQDGIYGADDLEDKRLLADASPAALGLIHLGADALPQLSRQTTDTLRSKADGALLTADQAAFASLRDFRQIALAGLPGGACWLGMHQGLWDALPPDLRKILAENSGLELSLALEQALREAARAELQRLKEAVPEIHYLSAQEREKLRLLTRQPLLDLWMEHAQQTGLSNPRALYDKIRRIVHK
jgi:TRAP-type C4-dicarboxylate transport system substrate-binding protein